MDAHALPSPRKAKEFSRVPAGDPMGAASSLQSIFCTSSHLVPTTNSRWLREVMGSLKITQLPSRQSSNPGLRKPVSSKDVLLPLFPRAPSPWQTPATEGNPKLPFLGLLMQSLQTPVALGFVGDQLPTLGCLQNSPRPLPGML